MGSRDSISQKLGYNINHPFAAAIVGNMFAYHLELFANLAAATTGVFED